LISFNGSDWIETNCSDLKSGISFISEQSKNTDKKTGSRDEKCSICLCDVTDKKTLNKCGHSFCAGCIDEAFKHQKKCPVCSQVYGPLIGIQPYGRMYDNHRATSLLGFGLWDTIVITYRFPNATQGPDHPNPGKPYTGTTQTAYLPNNQEGKKVLKLLKKAFEQKLTFTIRPLTTTGSDDCVVWNGIPHKTSIFGGPARYAFVCFDNDLFIWTSRTCTSMLYLLPNSSVI
jgi:deltex-like protein